MFKIIISSFKREKLLIKITNELTNFLVKTKYDFHIFCINDDPCSKLTSISNNKNVSYIKNNQNKGKVWNIMKVILDGNFNDNDWIIWLDDKLNIIPNYFEKSLKIVNKSLDSLYCFSINVGNKPISSSINSDSYINYYFKKNKKYEKIWFIKFKLFEKYLDSMLEETQKYEYIYDEYFIFKYICYEKINQPFLESICSCKYQENGITNNIQNIKIKHPKVVLDKSNDLLQKKISLKSKINCFLNLYLLNSFPEKKIYKIIMCPLIPLFWFWKLWKL